MKRPQSIYQTIFDKDENTFLQQENKIVVSGSIKARKYLVKGDVSSQFFSGLMFALPLLKEDSEIIIDGVFGTHRVLSFLGGFYNFLIGSFEYLAFLVLIACFVFLSRRNILKLKRFHMKEMTKWPKSDANIILITEIFLMVRADINKKVFNANLMQTNYPIT